MVAIRAPVDLYTDQVLLSNILHKRGILLNVYTFSTLLNGLILEDRILEAETLFNKLIKGKLCEHDLYMYTVMIKGLCKFGTNDTAIALLRLMDERGCKQNTMTYSTIINGLCKNTMASNLMSWYSASSRRIQFHRVHVGDNGAVVTPFVQVATYATRNFATLGQLELLLPFTGASIQSL
ncbi:LOW QUALITY PROTEIN: hypothetical protein OSB04_011372 [Centaurea solstitialis]|uniref:Pentatricopeptide repeat-containing protein n=1 Tax=Centaurea solstitialis TaxID=347529 RepID=A0AA38TGV2_9ASTR|nr:LOW QUALITY PROTEIN: hypothetical protein OSB04_011372 [Centaurea solstitialis]